MKSLIHSLVLSTALIGSTSLVHAQTFSSDFTNSAWITIGGSSLASNLAVVQSTSPSQGLSSASVSTIDSTLSVTLPATTGPASDGNFPGSHAAVNGQAIYQTFSVGSASELTFDFSFVTADNAPFDSTGYVLDGIYTALAGPSQSFTDEVANGINPPTAFAPAAAIPLSAGTHTLAFVAYNTGDNTASSSLSIENIVVVPEPSTWSLTLLVGVAFLVGRKFYSKSARS